MIAQEVTLQLAEAASQAAVLQLAATQAARVLKMKMMKEEACDLFVLKVVLQGARPPPLPVAALVRAAIRSLRLLPVCWRCWPWPGTPQLTPPVILASVVST
jgi:hypothetical protein